MEMYEDFVKLPDKKEKELRKIMILSHRYEYQTVCMVIKEEDNFTNIVDFIKEEIFQDSIEKVNKITMMEVNETNRYPFGKLFLEIRGIEDLYSNRDIRIDIDFNPYMLKSKVFDGKRYSTVRFDQRFYIPIHNRFNILVVKILRFSKEGILTANKRADVFKTFKFGIPFLRVSLFV